MTTGSIGDKIIAIIGVRSDQARAGSDTVAVVPPRRGRFAAPYTLDPACLGPVN
ncbi:MAG: hypothetical protein QGG19_05950 [Alphaproteobacteria bacterium]|nr:hypothetical protein [Alphaproteobacteria bacterium]MDP6256865.1 hypothetical protein [Alphaproteobacteria bacterium]MDP7054557.1 hypothetical protein [Alphaproteobacteria bacterium]MDP7227070.1 hypothetical protein [Alphaproteobacteria bacterium]MDP7461763.1 hypothetical protein [Alphaproteobacteria bacterium]